MTALVEATNLGYTVGGATLVDDVSLRVNRGEVVAVIGPNGAGKSTLVGLLSGDLKPTSGSVALAGLSMDELESSEVAAFRAVLTQERTQGIPFSVADVVAMGTSRSPVGADAVQAAMAAMDVDHLAHRVVGSLSGGEHSRVELARLLAQDTPLLLLDEPLGALDIGQQERVMRHLRSLAHAGKGVLAVFHDINAAAAHADRFILMRSGRVAGEGAPSEVLTAETLSAVYDHPMAIHHVGTRLVVTPADG